MGAVQTSSPTASISGLPASSSASTREPRLRHCISPAVTGRVGTPPTKQPAKSVPPEIGLSHTSAFTWR
jgi:hypothetical protein